MLRIPFAVVAILLIAGCYYYQPVDTPTPAPGSYLSARLTETGTDSLWRTVGPDVGEIRGHLLSSDGRALIFSVVAVSLRHGMDVSWKGESVTLDRSYVSDLRGRHLAKGRTVALAGLAMFGLVSSYKVLGGVGFGAPSGGTTGSK